MHLLQLTSRLAAEPASIIYIATGAAGLFLARLRPARQAKSSVVMLFCRRSSRETMAAIDLLEV